MKNERMKDMIEGAVADHMAGPPPLEAIRTNAKSARNRRRMGIAGAGLAVAAIIGGGVGIAAHERTTGTDAASPANLGPFTQAQFAVATQAAKDQIATFNDVQVTAVDGTLVTSPIDGTVRPCPVPSLQITMIGSFPRMATGGNTGEVTSETITVDPVTGSMCDVGVSTGPPPTFPDAANLTAAVLPN